MLGAENHLRTVWRIRNSCAVPTMDPSYNEHSPVSSRARECSSTICVYHQRNKRKLLTTLKKNWSRFKFGESARDGSRRPRVHEFQAKRGREFGLSATLVVFWPGLFVHTTSCFQLTKPWVSLNHCSSPILYFKIKPEVRIRLSSLSPILETKERVWSYVRIGGWFVIGKIINRSVMVLNVYTLLRQRVEKQFTNRSRLYR